MADPDAEIARLDAALERAGNTVVLQYITGSTKQAKFSVTCPAKVTTGPATDLVPGQGIGQQEMTIIISPSPLDAAQWPGPSVGGPADPRIPTKDKCAVTVAGVSRNVESAKGIFLGNPQKLIRIEILTKG